MHTGASTEKRPPCSHSAIACASSPGSRPRRAARYAWAALLDQLGEPITPPTVAPARGPPVWELPPAVQREIDPQAQPAPDDKFDQRVAL